MSQYPPNNSQPPSWQQPWQGNQSQYPPQQPWGVPPDQSGQWGQQQPQPPFWQPTQYNQPTQGWQQPVLPPPMQQGGKPPKKPLTKRDKIIGVGCFVVALLFLCGTIEAIATAANANHETASTPTATATAIIVNSQATDTPIPPTDTPTPRPTPTAVPKNLLGKQTVIGNTMTVWNAKYGQPFDQQTNANGSTTYKYLSSDSKISEIDVITFPQSQRIYGIVLGSPAGQNWDAITAITECLNFVPEDVKLDQASTVQNSSGVDEGLYQPGSSVELKNTLSSSNFFDADTGSSVTPGTFGMLYSYVAGSSATEVDACSTGVGKISTQALTNR